jgi:hypothetical protein
VDNACDAGTETTLSGIVYDPAGVTPLYNAIVYIPEDPGAALPTITPGTPASCAASSPACLATRAKGTSRRWLS